MPFVIVYGIPSQVSQSDLLRLQKEIRAGLAGV